MSPSFHIGLFGAGRVASHLAPALAAAGHQVDFIWSRSAEPAAALAAQVADAIALTGSLPSLPSADVYFLAVPDAAVAPLVATVPWPAQAIVVHLAGALSIDVFSPQPALRGGVFYPLQTFSPGRAIHWPSVPLCIEAADPTAKAILLALAHSLSQEVLLLDSAQRLRLHLAAVFANNFTNHLLGIADTLLGEAGLPPALLAPLIRETINKALVHPPFTVQTGPAMRRDILTLAAHRSALREHPAWLTLYNELSSSIQQQLTP